MSINTTKITSGPYTGNGIADVFDYTFKIINASQLKVFETTNLGVVTELTLNVDYSVNIIGDEGGTITRLTGALPVGYTWYIRSNYQLTQATTFTSQGAFFPDIHEDAFDKLTILSQQLQDGNERTLKIPESESSGLDMTLPTVAERAGRLLVFDEDGAPAEFAELSSIETVNTFAEHIDTVATNIADVNTVATNIVDVNTVATNIADVNTVATNIADVNTVATNIADVNTVVDNIVDIQNAEQNALDAKNALAEFEGMYYGVLTSDPALDPLGNPVTEGDLYFNSTLKKMRQYNGSVWVNPFADSADVSYDGTDSGLESLTTKTALDEVVIKLLATDYFKKSDSTKPAFEKTGAFSVSTSQQFDIQINGFIFPISASTIVTMPLSPVAGTDYAIWVKPDLTIEATTNHTTPPVTGSRKVGGFHYAPGGNATAQAGGDSTPQINEYSFWDINYRPNCPDPRGMVCINGGFWADLYLLNTDPEVNGTSALGVTIADGSSPPKIPTVFGGNGTTTYGSFTWFEAMEIATAFGKRAPTQQEFMAAAYGVTEATARGTDPVTTQLDAPRTSKFGLMQATGNLWAWAMHRAGPFAAASWNANTEGRGSEYNAPNASLLGAGWDGAADSGSRSSVWSFAASASAGSISLRCFCDHLQLD